LSLYYGIAAVWMLLTGGASHGYTSAVWSFLCWTHRPRMYHIFLKPRLWTHCFRTGRCV